MRGWCGGGTCAGALVLCTWTAATAGAQTFGPVAEVDDPAAAPELSVGADGTAGIVWDGFGDGFELRLRTPAGPLTAPPVQVASSGDFAAVAVTPGGTRGDRRDRPEPAAGDHQPGECRRPALRAAGADPASRRKRSLG